MPKRKSSIAEDDDDSGSDVDVVNVDFEFFDPRPIDYLAIKRLLNQLFGPDAESLGTSDLTDLILSQPLLGTTVKIDGIDSDPYAFLTVLNLNVHKEKPAVKALISYFLAKSASNASAQSVLQQITGADALSSSHHVGLLLGERLVNMPVQVIPPMYRMLGDEMQGANAAKEAYSFSHYIVISRLYRLTTADVTSMMDEDEEKQRPAKKKKKHQVASEKDSDMTPGIYSFHPEDDELQQIASVTLDYPFTNSQRGGESQNLGLDILGRLMVIPAERYSQLVQALATAHPIPGQSSL